MGTSAVTGSRSLRLDAGFRRLLERYPAVSSLLVLVVILMGLGNLTFALVGTLGDVLRIDRAQVVVVSEGVAKTTSALALFLILRHLGWAALVGFNSPAQWKHVWLMWLPGLYVLVNFVNLIGADITPNPNTAQIATSSLRGLYVAFFEETTFRGFVLAVMLNRYHSTRAQVTWSIIFSSVLFGFSHFPNDPDWETNVAQWIYAAFAGVGFSGVLLRTRSIWLLMAVHALIIAAGAITGGLAIQRAATDWDVRMSAILSVLATLPLLFYGLHLIRDIKSLDLTGFSRVAQGDR